MHEEPNVIKANDFHINENKVVFKKDGVEIIKKEYNPRIQLGFDVGF